MNRKLLRQRHGRGLVAFIASLAIAATSIVVFTAAGSPAHAVNTQVVYPANQTAQDFNDDTVEYCGTPFSLTDPLTCAKTGSGWKGYQENSLLCTVRGVTCPKWDTTYQDGKGDPNDVRPYGPSGQHGDGFIRTHGTSLAVAPCVPQVGNARWDSPSFVYDSPGATEWRLQLDTRQSYLLVGEGHAGWGVDIMDANGNVVTTAVPTQPTLPTNKWRHIDVSFDGSRLERGKTYYISIKVAVLHGETAGSWGDVDFDNIRLVTNTESADDEDPLTGCNPNAGDSIEEGIRQLLLGVPGMTEGFGEDDNTNGSFCGLTEGVGNMAEPALDPLIGLANDSAVSGLLDRGEGAFFVADLTAQQTVAWMIGGPAMPGADPRELLAWVHDGGAGNGPDYVVVFAIYNVTGTLGHVLEDPAGTLTGIVEGQLGNLQQVLDNPVGEFLDTDPLFVARSIREFTDKILGEFSNPTPQTQSLGGQAWLDADGDGVRTPGEAPAEGVPVRLLDCDDNQELDASVTGADGRYRFANVQPVYAPEGYCVEFDLAQYPAGTSFSPLHVGTATSETDSDVDPATEVGDPPKGRTVLVFISPDEHESTIDAGIIEGAGDGSGGGTGDGGSGDGSGIAGQVWSDTNTDGVRDAGEMGVQGVTTRLVGCDGSGTLATTVTDDAGRYEFTGLTAGDKCVEFDLASRPDTTTFTRPRVEGATAESDSDVDPETITGAPQQGTTFPVPVAAGEVNDTVGAGLTPPRNNGLLFKKLVRGIMWRDIDSDGIMEPTDGEGRLPGQPVRLIDAATGEVVASAKTGTAGAYALTPKRRGWYRVEFDTTGLANPVFSPLHAPGSTSQNDSDVDPGTATGDPFTGRTVPVFFDAVSDTPAVGAGLMCDL